MAMSINGTLPGKITWQGILLGVVLGVILAPQVSKIPGINKLPTV
jgi:hypothetical protein